MFAYNPEGDQHFKQKLYKEDKWEFHAITLSSLAKNIENDRYMQIKESGYGEPSYLISISDVKAIDKIKWNGT
jgi:hypothetical protein